MLFFTKGYDQSIEGKQSFEVVRVSSSGFWRRLFCDRRQFYPYDGGSMSLLIFGSIFHKYTASDSEETIWKLSASLDWCENLISYLDVTFLCNSDRAKASILIVNGRR
jgi:hypothetical protein